MASNHKVVSHPEWLEERKKLLAKEKEFNRLRDQLSAQRRELPWERVDKQYTFEGPNGKETLPQIFDGASQLVVYHFILGRQFRSYSDSSQASRHQLRRDLARAVRQTRGLPQAHGMELQMAVVVRQRFQFRLLCIVHA
jgi:predicted dithiol-disulfide oxidoreductase (DUF899 family)